MLFGWKMSNGPGLVIWTGPRSEISNGCEVRTPNGVCVGKFWSDPGLVVCWDVWLEKPMVLSLAMGSGDSLEFFSEWNPAQSS